jgi:hypothetical protein
MTGAPGSPGRRVSRLKLRPVIRLNRHWKVSNHTCRGRDGLLVLLHQIAHAVERRTDVFPTVTGAAQFSAPLTTNARLPEVLHFQDWTPSNTVLRLVSLGGNHVFRLL